ncbi:uncharacterized protein LOC142329441 [Lycorma delicatula]|uniref:uncharacterized protein LOC142329441 n=1 Tax=Lycorma delicatula TaxID=130591 RepID=UPI003F514B65
MKMALENYLYLILSLIFILTVLGESNAQDSEIINDGSWKMSKRNRYSLEETNPYYSKHRTQSAFYRYPLKNDEESKNSDRTRTRVTRDQRFALDGYSTHYCNHEPCNRGSTGGGFPPIYRPNPRPSDWHPLPKQSRFRRDIGEGLRNVVYFIDKKNSRKGK